MKKIVAYYSWSGKTAEMAEAIAKLTDAELVGIKPETPYSYDYKTCVEESMFQVEKGDCPPVEYDKVNMDEVDTVYFGTPIWFGTIAGPLLTFINENDKLKGKKIAVFCTHGGGGKGHIDEDIAKFCPDAEILETLSVKEGGTPEEIAQWVEKIK